MSYKLFKMIDGELCLDRDEVLLHDELLAVWKLDKGSKGDSNGRRHLLAFRYFKFIYLVCDPYAYPSKMGLNEKDAVKYALKHVDVPSDILNDTTITTAMQFYITHTVSLAAESAYEMRRSIGNTTKAMNKVNNIVEKTIDKPDATKTEMDDLFAYQERINKLIVDAPSRFKLLDELEKIADDVIAIPVEARGGGVVEDSMDPKKAI